MKVVETGFMKTDIGMIPSDWKLRSIASFAKITTGAKDTQDRNDSGKYPFYVRSQKVERIGSFSLDTEAVLTSGDGVGVGKIYHYIDGKFDFHQRVYCMYNFKEEVYAKYFFYQFTNKFYDRVMSMTAKSSVDSVRREMIADMKLPLPTLHEQKAIATALSDVDALIKKLDELIEKKQNIKKATMQLLLTGKKRLDGFVGEWGFQPLGQLAKITMGQSPSSSNYNSEGIGLPLVQGNADIQDRKTIIRNYTSQITKTGKEGDIIMSVRAPVGEVANAAFDCCLGRGVCSITYPNKYLYQYLLLIEPNWAKYSTGSTFDSINSNQLSNIIVPIPNEREEQSAIAEVLADMDSEIGRLVAKRNKYQLIKQGMMKKLLTGKIRLSYD